MQLIHSVYSSKQINAAIKMIIRVITLLKRAKKSAFF